MELLQLLIAGIAQGCVYGLLALGFVLIYKATEQVNFAQGDIMMMGTFFAFTFITGVTKPVQWSLIPAVLIAGAAAAFFYFFLHKRRLPAWRERAIEQRTTPEMVLTIVYWCNVVAITALAGAALILTIRFFGGFGMSWWLGLPLAAVFGAILGYALDAVIVRLHAGRRDGELLTEEKFGWYAAPSWQLRAGEPLPVATMPEPCGVRVLAGQLLDQADVPWREVFVGGGVAAVSAAVMAGLGVSALARRMLPFGAVDVGAKLGLPELPRLPVVLHARVKDGRPRDALVALSAAFRSVVRD